MKRSPSHITAGFVALLVGNSLHAALARPAQREPALITFRVTASGVTLFNVGVAFWGLVAGMAALAILRHRDLLR